MVIRWQVMSLRGSPKTLDGEYNLGDLVSNATAFKQ